MKNKTCKRLLIIFHKRNTVFFCNMSNSLIIRKTVFMLLCIVWSKLGRSLVPNDSLNERKFCEKIWALFTKLNFSKRVKIGNFRESFFLLFLISLWAFLRPEICQFVRLNFAKRLNFANLDHYHNKYYQEY